ncbi:hypothetical protein J6590_081548 [Homalodisca vitripennis]|nr:hypothetical protein J6590_081548 [Homalodisca vitripennis]
METRILFKKREGIELCQENGTSKELQLSRAVARAGGDAGVTREGLTHRFPRSCDVRGSPHGLEIPSYYFLSSL